MRVKAKLSNTNIRKGKRKRDMRCFGQYTRALKRCCKNCKRELQKDLHHYLQPKCAHCHGLKYISFRRHSI